MSASIDRILDVLDVGLQTSDEHGYGTDLNGDACARCQRHEPAEGGDLCTGCRAFLLGDTNEDPAPVRSAHHEAEIDAIAAIGVSATHFSTHLLAMSVALAEQMAAIRNILNEPPP